MAYPHIAERLFGHPQCIEPAAFRTILEGPLARRVLSGELAEARASKKQKQQLKASTSRLSAIVDCQPVMVAGGVAEFGLTDEGVAILPVCGVLSRRFDWLTALCGWTTYEGLSAAFDQMLADSRVKAILMDVESPGGEAAGMLDICDKIIAARSIKPVWAVANTFAASAAYGVAGSAERLVLPRLGQVGSIGAVIVHIDQSAYDAASGDKYTAIYSGERKIDGWAHAPLSDGAAKTLQANVDNCRQQFCDLVGRQGRMTTSQAMKTEAGVAADNSAVDGRYADAVATFEDALAELTDLAAGRSHSISAAASAGLTGGPSPMKTEKTAATAETVPAKIETTVATTTTQPAAAAADDGDNGDKCPSCNGSGKKPQASAQQAAPQAAAPAAAATATEAGYTIEMANETLELCAIAGVSSAEARKFTAAKTPVEKVRADLAAAKANASDAVALNTAPAAGSEAKQATAGWDDAIAQANKLNGIPTK
ncbi:S49 family peptidase [Bradyrhizobium sp. 4]|uniref:S49 family peptidase n=1 Tax=unclassified Bradyrhizobium TaxID=2631580 RepID=UPI001FF98142|nr:MULTISPECIES: S49 family peptidase [unclassified Bradyrhizobium]MCK1402031.1 S49 family peptidase [Bradyrhizobium sp. 39]MCK1751249.1 S49 family peptidase [Bradyrhizobium sp. 135]UPJ38502.1 S49 family peptidase [Bradyrhizobium sp. 4]